MSAEYSDWIPEDTLPEVSGWYQCRYCSTCRPKWRYFDATHGVWLALPPKEYKLEMVRGDTPPHLAAKCFTFFGAPPFQYGGAWRGVV